MMFRKVLLRHGFRRNRRSDELQYIGHWDKLGGIYVTLKPKMAVVEVKDRNAIYVFRSARELELFIRDLKTSVNMA